MDIGVVTKEKHSTEDLLVLCYVVLVFIEILRKVQPYEVYSKLDFEIPIGRTGDCYDRYLVTNVKKCGKALNIILQCVNQIPQGIVRN